MNDDAGGKSVLSEGLGLTTLMGRLLDFCAWERVHRPGPDGQPHIAEWAACEIERLRGIVPEVLERLNDELCAENEALRSKLDRALTVCRCAARVVDSSAYQGVSDEDCDLEMAVRNWRALGPNGSLERHVAMSARRVG